MEEHNIPIDMVGGVSIGAFNGAVYCEELKAEDMEPRVFSWCQDMSSLWKKVMDITYPITAMFSGKHIGIQWGHLLWRTQGTRYGIGCVLLVPRHVIIMEEGYWHNMPSHSHVLR